MQLYFVESGKDRVCPVLCPLCERLGLAKNQKEAKALDRFFTACNIGKAAVDFSNSGV